jgi:formate dehydrogenase beta subunit
MAESAILFDTSRCSGCHACQVACKCWNNLPSPLGLNENKWSGSHQNPADINGTTRLIMTYNEIENPDYNTKDVTPLLATKRVKWAFGRRSCQHCTDAGCVDVCPAGALYHDEDTGMVTYDQDKCIGCQNCSTACPFDVPRYDEGTTRGVINKCSGCVDRIANGMKPACVTTCQPEALDFGPRDEMIQKAYLRLSMLKQRGYKDAVVYGEHEMGGLHVIQVLKYGAAAHGAVENPKSSGALVISGALKPITAVVFPLCLVAFAGMTALASGYKRDTLVFNNETQDTIAVNTGEVVKHGMRPMDERQVIDAVTENLPFMEANRKKKAEEKAAAAEAAEVAKAAAAEKVAAAQVEAAEERKEDE